MVKGRAYLRQAPQPEKVPEKTNFIREWRERPTEEHPKGLSQVKLGELAGVDDASISAYERMENDPSLDSLRKLGKAIGVPCGMLLDIDPSSDPELWDSWLRADDGQRQILNKIASGLVGQTTKKKRK